MFLKFLTKKLQKETLIESMNPFLGIDINDKSLLITKSLDYVKVLRISGKEYSGLDEKVIQGLFNIRKMFLENIDENIVVTTHSQREKDKLLTHIELSNKYQDKIAKVWQKNFKESYKTYHYIVIASSSLSSFSDLSIFDDLIAGNSSHKKDTVIKNTKKIENYLKEYEPEELIGTNLVSFFSSFINGKKSNRSLSKDGFLNDSLSGATIKFPLNKDYMTYENNYKIFSKWLSIVFYNNDVFNPRLLEDLMSLKAEFTLYQSFRKMQKEKAKNFVEDKENNVNAFFKSSDAALKNLKTMMSNIEQGEISLFNYSFTLQVRSDNLDELKTMVSLIQGLVENYGYKTVVETTNIEPLFWSCLPTLEHINTRKRVLTSKNISSLNTFTTVSQGLSSSSWGNMPITKFYNSHNTVYDFVLHNSTKPQALGHTLFIGGSDKGKTTLVSFLISQMMKYPNFKALVLDKLKGMKVFTEILDGTYADFNKGISLNPMQLEDSLENREFLKNFLQHMTGKSDEDAEATKLIDYAIENNYENLDFKDRNIEHILPAFGSNTGINDIVANMENWVYGSNKRFFCSPNDSLNFDNQITTFNMDSVFHNEKATGLIALYMFHKLKQVVTATNSPFFMFIDELPSYIKDDNFGKKILEVLVESRKLDGILGLACQNVKQLTDNKYGRQILGSDSIANYVIYPDSTISEETKEVLNLTSEEFKFLKETAKPREILFKRVGGASTILNINLEPLDKYLNIFNSSSTAVTYVNNLKKKNPINWKEEYLND